MKQRKIVIIGAAGRDFHNFNTVYRDKPDCRVLAFTAAQIPDIANRKYPAALAGGLYPEGIPIHAQDDLESLIKDLEVDECVFSYSDISYNTVMGVGARVNAAGADFTLLGYKNTMLKSVKPVIAVGAVRTGCGKSQTSCRVAEILTDQGLKVIAVRHPMPYGDLEAQKVQRFAAVDDLARHNCTIEEMEEYEPHIARGHVIYAGVDYEAILRSAENDPNGCDVILWDGGNNDFPFYRPDLMLTVTDPCRPGHELGYYPGEVTLRLADVAIINKIDSADFENIELVRNNIERVNPRAVVVDAASVISVDKPEVIRGKRVLVIEDGPTLTHGEMKIGAGMVAAHRFGAAEIIDPRPYAVGRLAETFRLYPDVGTLLPAMGYGPQQMSDLAATIERADCDSVVIATPINLKRVVEINKPSTRVKYALQEIGRPNLYDILTNFVKQEAQTLISAS
ncbi:MAG: cyclic 2,3-diphosphoglycerate synthase [Deltaproteobacteria bacterium]|nr:cyclic 2,3-diphosphoglycerate synthase [Deltaproteobacteria bacterium]